VLILDDCTLLHVRLTCLLCDELMLDEHVAFASLTHIAIRALQLVAPIGAFGHVLVAPINPPPCPLGKDVPVTSLPDQPGLCAVWQEAHRHF
jgi:hypothetical protein